MNSVYAKCVPFLVVVFLTGCGRSGFYSDLASNEANEMRRALSQRTLDVHKTERGDGLFLIRVADSDEDTAITVPGDYNSPRNLREAGEPCSEVHKNNSANDVRCVLQANIESMLEQIEGVVSARVSLSFPTSDSAKDSSDKDNKK